LSIAIVADGPTARGDGPRDTDAPPTDARPAPDRTALAVEIFASGPSESVRRLEGAVAAPGQPIRWVTVPRIDGANILEASSGRGPQKVVRVWVDASHPDLVRLYFANWNAERFLARDVMLAQGLDEPALETVAQVIESSVSALASDESIGMSRREMTSAIQANLGAAPIDAHPSPWHGSIGAFYAAEVFSSDQGVLQGPGLMTGVERRDGPWVFGAWLSAQYVLPKTIETALIGVRLDSVALRAGPEVSRAITDHFDLAARAGWGGDIVSISPREAVAGPRATLDAARLSWDDVAQIALIATGHPSPSLAIWAAIFCDVDLVLRHYDVLVNGVPSEVVTPWRVRPGLMAGAEWP
jgi:hypothetical protein